MRGCSGKRVCRNTSPTCRPSGAARQQHQLTGFSQARKSREGWGLIDNADKRQVGKVATLCQQLGADDNAGLGGPDIIQKAF